MRTWGLVMVLVAACGADPEPGSSPDAGADDPDGAPTFELEVHTRLTDAGALALETNLPMREADCAAVPGAPCADADGDGLTDAWEDVALDRLRPVARFDEAEQLLDDPAGVAGDIGRVAPVDGGAILFIVLAYSKDYGSCGVSGHDGDPERVALHVVAHGGGDVEVADAYTAAHEGTAADHGRVFTGADLAQLVHEPLTAGEPRWVVYPSRDKHGTYATIDICENVSVVPCLDEACAPDDVADPAAFDRLPPVVNAGEDGARLVTDLAAVGFPGEDAWADQSFCGGIDSTNCSAKVRDKLTADPFGLL